MRPNVSTQLTLQPLLLTQLLGALVRASASRGHEYSEDLRRSVAQ